MLHTPGLRSLNKRNPPFPGLSTNIENHGDNDDRGTLHKYCSTKQWKITRWFAFWVELSPLHFSKSRRKDGRAYPGDDDEDFDYSDDEKYLPSYARTLVWLSRKYDTSHLPHSARDPSDPWIVTEPGFQGLCFRNPYLGWETVSVHAVHARGTGTPVDQRFKTKSGTRTFSLESQNPNGSPSSDSALTRKAWRLMTTIRMQTWTQTWTQATRVILIPTRARKAQNAATVGTVGAMNLSPVGNFIAPAVGIARTKSWCPSLFGSHIFAYVVEHGIPDFTPLEFDFDNEDYKHLVEAPKLLYPLGPVKKLELDGLKIGLPGPQAKTGVTDPFRFTKALQQYKVKFSKEIARYMHASPSTMGPGWTIGGNLTDVSTWSPYLRRLWRNGSTRRLGYQGPERETDLPPDPLPSWIIKNLCAGQMAIHVLLPKGWSSIYTTEWKLQESFMELAQSVLRMPLRDWGEEYVEATWKIWRCCE
ncbi:hypothetical protein QBC38DRAFT_550615 [Podospora fimiseda]|uniref:Uncharacterized protein n=1 Tax=Podospora fimiseda TaxID=252190 RepID=A0AAN6YL68_9PEZI|nr:hypothetical protein QBC38DRAFT_550615 [Podospora fimiseda]